ncbi:hypothetical protein GGI22_002147, partial [Coemansia erecta]
MFKFSSSPVRVFGTRVVVNALFTNSGSKAVCTVDKSLFCIGFWDKVQLSGRICLPRRSGKTYNLIQLLLFFSCAPEKSQLDVPDSAVEEFGHSAEQIRLMGVAEKCRLKRELLFKDSLLKEKHPAFVEEHFMKYPVIHISFSLCKAPSPGEFLVSLCAAIATAAEHWLEEYAMIEGVDVDSNDNKLEKLRRLLSVYDNSYFDVKEFASRHAGLPIQLFDCLSEFVRSHFGKYILLLDEYDVPFIRTHSESWKDEDGRLEMQDLLKRLIQTMFK